MYCMHTKYCTINVEHTIYLRLPLYNVYIYQLLYQCRDLNDYYTGFILLFQVFRDFCRSIGVANIR